MVLTFLTYIFFTGGVVAILYAMLALLSLMNHARVQKKALPERYESGADTPATTGPDVAEAFWGRAEILLHNGRFDAALADCKRVLEINPDHAEAKRLWNRLFPPEPISIVPSGKAIPAAAEVENASHIVEIK